MAASNDPCAFCQNTRDMSRGMDRRICAPCWNERRRLPDAAAASCDDLRKRVERLERVVRALAWGKSEVQRLLEE